MTNQQIWQTIALDLKRAANYQAAGSVGKAEYYLAEAKNLYSSQILEGKMKQIEKFILFKGKAEDLLLAGSLIQLRV